MAELREHGTSVLPPLLIADGVAFEELYKRHWEKVFAVCYQGTRDNCLAEDLMHEIFQSLWERRNELRLHGAAEHYLVRAAKLTVMAHHRDNINRDNHFGNAMQSYSGHENTTENEVNYQFLHQHVNQLVTDLPKPCQEVYVMSREEGLPNKTIAAALLISEKTVEYHLTRALRFLNKHLVSYRS